MLSWLTALKATMTAAQWVAWFARFQEWRRERDAKRAAEKIAKVFLLFAVSYLSAGASCRNLATDIAQYCQERPWECGGPKPTPTPIPAPTVTPCPDGSVPSGQVNTCAPVATPTPCPPGQHIADYRGLICVPDEPMPTSTPVPAATLTPVSTPTPEPTPVPQCVAAPDPPASPVSLAFRGGCPRGFERLAYDISGPGGTVLCAVKSTCDQDGHAACFADGDRPAWRIGFDIDHGHRKLLQYGDKWLAHDDGRGCVDAYGRFFPDSGGCLKLYEHPEGPSAAWTHDGMAMPFKCPTPTPTPGPTPVGTPSTSCAPVESTEHWMAPGDHCHLWERDMGRIRCLVDSTIRPICDHDHQENWDGVCGKRFHDPDYDSEAGAQTWAISGAEDLGPHRKNSAQRWMVGEPGAEVGVTVCIRPDAVTPDGCKITRRGDGCGSRIFRLPTGLE